MKLDLQEREILDAYESGKMDPQTPSKALMSDLSQAAENTFKKDKRINIRLSRHDLSAIQRKALQQGIPYQTLISGLIHRYVEGDIQEKTAKIG